MIAVLFDTNILHQEGLYSTRIQRFQRLLKESECKLIIPEIVIEEYRSKRISIAEQEFSIIKKSWDKLQRKKLIKIDGEVFSYSLNSTYKDCINNISTSIDSWLKENNVEIYKISNTCIDNLFKNYFAGHGAFREKKSREDIPDAVIYDAIINIAKETKLYVIVKDNGLQKALKEIKNVECLPSLDDFLNIDSIKETTIKLDKKESRISNILEYLGSADAGIHLESYLNGVGINNLDNTFSSDMINAFYFKDIPIIEAELIALDQSKEKEIYFYNPSYLENNKFCIYFKFDSRASIKFSCRCQEDDFDDLPRRLSKAISIKETDDSDVLDVSGILDVEFLGVIIMSNISEEFTPQELDIHFSYMGSEQCEISCAVDIESVDISYL